jgi:hypothetical protein
VRNLLGETFLPAGRQTVYWDGYDDGTRDESGDRLRHRVPPGDYRVRGLVHDRIRMRYEFSVYSPGTPPWKTKDGSGAWLADHSPPADVLFLPAGRGLAAHASEDQLLVCSTSGESGDEFVWLNGEGRRITGFNAGFWGGTHLARDLGPKALRDDAAYVLESGERDPDNDTIEIRAFKTGGEMESVWKTTFPMEWKRSVLPVFKSNAEAYGTNGLAAYDGRLAFAFTRRNKIVFIDARTKSTLGEATIRSPRGLQCDARGRLYVITGKRIRRFEMSAKPPFLINGTTIVASELESPRRIALDAAGNLYVSEGGRSHQVKVFRPDGTLLRKIGRPGGPQVGRYDERRMSDPSGMTIDRKGRLWVAEAETYPKRLSLWKTDGTFLRAWYGPPKYGGGGSLDPKDPSRLYYAEYDRGGGIEFALDWKTGSAKPESVYWRPGATNAEPMPGPAPERAFVVGGRRYLVNCYNGQLRYNQDRGTGIWRLDPDDIARPVAIIANAGDLNNSVWGFPMKNKAAINALWKGHDPSRVMFVWTDRNDDRIAQPGEVSWVENDDRARKSDIGDLGLQPIVHADLSVTTSWGTLLPPPKIDSRGELSYDLNARKTIGNASELRSPEIGGGRTLVFEDGDPTSLAGADLNGGERWRIVGVAGGQPVPGQLVQATRPLGPPVTPAAGDAGPILAVNGEMGEFFLVTMDGMFLQTMGGDNRFTPLWRMPAAKRGMLIDGVSFAQEHFHPTITRTPDGAIYCVAGHEHSSIVRLEGLETTRRFDAGTISVKAPDLAGLPETQMEKALRTGRQTLPVALGATEPVIDGNLEDWPAGTEWAALDSRASAAVRLTPGALYAAFRLREPEALDNAGGDFHYLFKKGGALDLMIGARDADPKRTAPTAGDLRLLVTRVGERTRAVLYRAVAPEAPAEQGFTFDSPIGRVRFDQVLDVSDRVRLARNGGDVEFSVPLSLLGGPFKTGDEILGDLGVLRGGQGQTTQRIYWNNRNTQIVSDVPSEARLQPENWGVWKIVGSDSETPSKGAEAGSAKGNAP